MSAHIEELAARARVRAHAVGHPEWENACRSCGCQLLTIDGGECKRCAITRHIWGNPLIDEYLALARTKSPEEFRKQYECSWPVQQPYEGVSCGHKGCLSHTTHPCEGCGRIAGILPAGCTDAMDK